MIIFKRNIFTVRVTFRKLFFNTINFLLLTLEKILIEMKTKFYINVILLIC